VNAYRRRGIRSRCLSNPSNRFNHITAQASAAGVLIA
jgi:hypothetical protein